MIVLILCRKVQTEILFLMICPFLDLIMKKKQEINIKTSTSGEGSSSQQSSTRRILDDAEEDDFLAVNNAVSLIKHHLRD